MKSGSKVLYFWNQLSEAIVPFVFAGIINVGTIFFLANSVDITTNTFFAGALSFGGGWVVWWFYNRNNKEKKKIKEKQ